MRPTSNSVFQRIPLCLAFAASPLLASGHSLYDQSDLSPIGGANISSVVFANDFEVPQTSRADSVTFWAVGETYNPDLVGGGPAGFVGSIGWAIYSDDGGAPDTLLYSGTDATPDLVDTGLMALGEPLFRVRIDLDGTPHLFGHYWLALREGPWGGAAPDNTGFFWVIAASQVGPNKYYGGNPQSPVWQPSGAGDLAFFVEGDPVFWHQERVAETGSANISSGVVAAEFELSSETRLGSLDAWLSDFVSNDNGVLDSFAGTLSWAIYADAGGSPAMGAPLFSGHDSTPILTDTGLQESGSWDIVRARIELAGQPTLGPGTYWLALHEGTWEQASDGNPLWWMQTTFVVGLPGYSSGVSPTTWTALGSADYAFVLFEDELFASGFEAGVTCGWAGASGGDCP